MGDEHISQSHLLLQVFHQVQNLSLNGHIQSRYRFVAHDELGVHGQSAGDTDSLTAAAVQLVGISVVQTLGQTYDLHQLQNLLLQLLLVCHHLVQQQGLGDGLANGLSGVQRGERILEDDLQIFSLLPHLFLAQLCQVFSLEQHFASSGLQQSQDGAACGGFTAAGLAYHTQGLAFVDGEGDVVHRVQHTSRRAEVFFEAFYL